MEQLSKTFVKLCDILPLPLYFGNTYSSTMKLLKKMISKINCTFQKNTPPHALSLFFNDLPFI